jgi:hypothetical protein
MLPDVDRSAAMSLSGTLLAVWQQALVEHRTAVELGDREYRLGRTSRRRLRTVDFEYDGRRITGIEQNPDTSSRWATLARQGQRIMQFSYGGRYFANVAEGKLMRYPAWAALELPE